MEQFRADEDTVGVWHGSLTFGLNASQKNRRSIQFNNRSSLNYVGRRNVYMMINNISFIQVEDELASDGHVHLRTTFNHRNRWSPEVFTQFQYSQDWGMLRRYLAGGGIRFDLVNTEGFTSALTTGAMFEHEVWRAEDGPRQEFNRLKSTTSLLMRGRLSPNTTLLTVAYYQAKPDNFFKPRLTGDIEFRFQISRLITFGARFSTTYDADPAIDVTDWIYSVTNQITFSF